MKNDRNGYIIAGFKSANRNILIFLEKNSKPSVFLINFPLIDIANFWMNVK